MTDQFFEKPILNSPYSYPSQHWELDADGQPTNQILEYRRSAKFITPVPMPKKRRRGEGEQIAMPLDEGRGSRQSSKHMIRPATSIRSAAMSIGGASSLTPATGA